MEIPFQNSALLVQFKDNLDKDIPVQTTKVILAEQNGSTKGCGNLLDNIFGDSSIPKSNKCKIIK